MKGEDNTNQHGIEFFIEKYPEDEKAVFFRFSFNSLFGKNADRLAEPAAQPADRCGRGFCFQGCLPGLQRCSNQEEKQGSGKAEPRKSEGTISSRSVSPEIRNRRAAED